MTALSRKPRSLFKARPPYEIHASKLTPKHFASTLRNYGAILIRGAGDPRLLEEIRERCVGWLKQYEHMSEEELTYRAKEGPEAERSFWWHVRLGHVYDYRLKEAGGEYMPFHEVLRRSGMEKMTQLAFPEYQFSRSKVTNARRVNSIRPGRIFSDAPISFHVDAQYHFEKAFSINFWAPMVHCGIDAPSLEVILSPIEETKRFLDYKPEGHPPREKDYANMHKFLTHKATPEIIAEHYGKDAFYAPVMEPGDMLAFSNHTLHRTHMVKGMEKQRISLELRLDGYPWPKPKAAN